MARDWPAIGQLGFLERSGNKRARLVTGPVEHAYAPPAPTPSILTSLPALCLRLAQGAFRPLENL